MKDFSGKTALITGGAQGIGRAVAEAYLRRGGAVALLDHDEEALAETRTTCRALGEVLALRGDVAGEEDVPGAVAAVLERFGRLDLLVNNAGIMIRKPVAELTLAEWNTVLGVNLTGMFLCAKHAAPALAEAGGAIVNVASTRAFQSEPDTEAYAASKGGVIGLTHALAASLGPKVRVNAVTPGWIDVTPWQKLSARKPEKLRPRDHAQHPAGRVGVPGDVAEMVLFLASERASFITGACFPVDGGMTRKMMYEN
jgi:NAD(P)-dependent dehydrogenase (short-subunit alcohol dehydrogenase family)